jgi:5-methyltetrahydropteroyltriglutamate--homocysteine methyltransferase
MNSFRAETVGSLLRPEWLKKGRADLAENRINHAEFKQLEDRAVDEAIALQESCGLDSVSDGEQRRTIFIGPLTDCVEGVGLVSETIETMEHWKESEGGGNQAVTKLAVVGKLRRRQSLTAEEFTYLRARARRPIKMTVPSPLMLSLIYSPAHSGTAYPNPFELFADAVDIVRQEVRELASLGCQYIQIDAPELATLVDPQTRANVYEAQGISTDRMLDEGIEMLNSVVDVPGVTFGIHLCRGNNAGHYMASGGYEAISKQVFKRARNFHRFFLEYDDARSGTFEALEDVPRDKTVVLGLVSTKRPELEAADLLVHRVKEASRHFPLEQMAISPQCGFASVMAGNPIAAQVQEAKLRLVAATAHKVWPQQYSAGP